MSHIVVIFKPWVSPMRSEHANMLTCSQQPSVQHPGGVSKLVAAVLIIAQGVDPVQSPQDGLSGKFQWVWFSLGPRSIKSGLPRVYLGSTCDVSHVISYTRPSSPLFFLGAGRGERKGWGRGYPYYTSHHSRLRSCSNEQNKPVLSRY